MGAVTSEILSAAMAARRLEVSVALEKARMSMESRRAQEQDKMKGSQMLAVEDIRKL